MSLLKSWIDEFSDPDDVETIARNHTFYQRIPRNSYFVGRNAILKSLSEVFCCNASIKQRKTAAIVGLGGQGKTQVAAEYVYRNEGNYNAITWINAESQSTITTDLARWAFLMKLVPPRSTAEEAFVAAKNLSLIHI